MCPKSSAAMAWRRASWPRPSWSSCAARTAANSSCRPTPRIGARARSGVYWRLFIGPRPKRQMKLPFAGAIDCDLHPAVPDVAALMPYLDDFWREHLTERYIDHSPFVLASYAQNLPQSARADWRPKQGVPGAALAALRRDALDAFGTRFAIANVLHGAVALYNADMAAALCKAVNSWIAQEWLRPRAAAARVDPGAAPGHRACRRRDRALRARSQVRPGAAAGDGRPAARPSQ